MPGGRCDQRTGQCPCREGAEGLQCTDCAHNYYYNRSSQLQGKRLLRETPTMDGLSLCDVSEQLGARILFHFLVDSTCAQSDEWSQGCALCTCDPRGTVPGSVCDSTTGQCVCLPTRHGRDCSHCRPGEAL